ncbi:MAG: hypothetical protein KatS3mg078_1677 [Deltaproteobacteria bacterium]|nr:MAG: hypothetical protein KatS3mg078_1677 [Deltaproteobacteria bacterium]
MELLMTLDKDRFDEYVAEVRTSFDRCLAEIKEELQIFPNAYCAKQISDYLEYIYWPARLMEYSYVLRIIEFYREGCNCMSSLNIVDLGCDPSMFPLIVAKKFQANVLGVDNDSELIRGLKSFRPFRKIGLLSADITSLPFDNSEFDVAYSVSVLEHIPQSKRLQAIREALRVVKPEGFVILTVDYRDLNLVSLILKTLSRLRVAFRFLRSTGVKNTVRAALAPKPYSYRDLEYLSKVFGDSLVKGPKRALSRLSLGKIRSFWNRFYRDDFSYDKKLGRDYTSVGIIFTNNEELKARLRRSSLGP